MRPRHHAPPHDVVQVRSATDVTEDHLYYRANEEPFEYPARHGSTDEERDSNHRRPSQPYSSQSVEAPGRCSTARTRATVRRVVVDRVERIASRNDRAPQQQRRKNEKHQRTLHDDAERDDDADDPGLQHQRRIQLLVYVWGGKALHANEPKCDSRITPPAGDRASRVITSALCSCPAADSIGGADITNGTTMKPAPCADAMRNDQTVRSRNPTAFRRIAAASTCSVYLPIRVAGLRR